MNESSNRSRLILEDSYCFREQHCLAYNFCLSLSGLSSILRICNSKSMLLQGSIWKTNYAFFFVCLFRDLISIDLSIVFWERCRHHINHRVVKERYSGKNVLKYSVLCNLNLSEAPIVSCCCIHLVFDI